MVGDVIWTPFPFTSLRRFKSRPVVVIAKSGLDEWDDWIVCQVTRTSHKRPTSIDIDPNDMIEGQLSQRSLVRPDRIATLNERVFEFKMGRLTTTKLAEILTATRALFQPPSRT